jgi:hypothetical protein
MTGLRFLRAAGALVASALLLTGCMRLNMSLTVNADDTIDGQLLLTAEKSILTTNGRTPQQGFADLRKNIPAMPPGPEEVYEDAERYGTLIRYDHTPLSQFNSESIKLVETGGTYRFTLPLDPTLYGNAAPSATPQSRDTFMKAMEFEIQVTFPGTVVDSNGTEVGRTVTWQIKAGQDKPEQLFATSDIPSSAPASPAGGGHSGLPWLLIIAGAAIVAVAAVAVVAVFLLMRHSGPGAAAAEPGTAAEVSAGTTPPPGAA